MFWRASVEREVDSELTFHLEMTTRELMERGMPRAQARAEAERRFGDRNAVDAECRRYGNERDRKDRRAEFWDEVRQDITFAARQLLRARAFAAVAILTLALGIGATAAVFSALDAVVLRPLPFDHPDQIVTIMATKGSRQSAVTPGEFLALRDSRVFAHIGAGVLGSGFTLILGDTPEMINGGLVSADYFAAFGAAPQLGRTFTTAEDSPGNAPVVIISHRLWASHFNSDAHVVGRSIQVDGVSRVIVGVMPASFDLTHDSEDMWLPLALASDQATNFGSSYLDVVARLPRGTTIAQARSAATAALRGAVVERLPDRTEPISNWTVDLRGFAESFVGDYRSLLFILLGAVGFVLLIACTNVANLLLARGSVRSKELAIRAALGAGRGRLVRQLLTESLVLGVAGSVLGLGIAYALLRVIHAVSPADVPRLDQARVDWRVLAFTLSIGVVSCVVFGLLPALRAAGPRLNGTLREGGRRGTAGRDGVRGVLVSVEVALAITLLVASGLLIRSALLVQRVDPGFDPHGVLAARFVLPNAQYPTGAGVIRAYSEIRDRSAAIPGVASSAITSVVPLSSSSMRTSVGIEGSAPSAALTANVRLVSDGYFSTMRIPLLAGRDMTRHDDASSPLVVVISRSLAEALWPNTPVISALGKRIDALPGEKKGDRHIMEIVGIVGDLHEDKLNQPPAPELYAPYTQTPDVFWPFLQRSLVVVLRAANSASDAQLLEKPLRRVVAGIDPSLPIAEARTTESYLRESLATARMNTMLLSLLGSIALVLAMVGIYGVVSYFVSQRTHEIGVRMALGATPRRIWQHVARVGLAPVGVGLIAGLALSSLTSTLLRGQLYQVSAHDPVTLGATAIVLLLVGLMATYVPARRAMRVPPLVALNDG